MCFCCVCVFVSSVQFEDSEEKNILVKHVLSHCFFCCVVLNGLELLRTSGVCSTGHWKIEGLVVMWTLSVLALVGDALW